MKNLHCPACGQDSLNSVEEVREFGPPSVKTPIRVTLHTSRCAHCGARVTSREQRAANLATLAARKAEYGEWLMGEEVLALRKKYGLTQQQASEVFGRGKIAFSRYESESSYPDLAMTRLMRLALDDAHVMKRLATMAGVEAPLIDKRIGSSAQWGSFATEYRFAVEVFTLSHASETSRLYGANIPDHKWNAVQIADVAGNDGHFVSRNAA